MFTIQLTCECGFVSDEAYWGLRSVFEQHKIGIPVFVPAAGRVLTHWIDCELQNIEIEDCDAWIAEHSAELIRAEYGKDAIRLLPTESNKEFLHCPKCNRYRMKVGITGIH